MYNVCSYKKLAAGTTNVTVLPTMIHKIVLVNGGAACNVSMLNGPAGDDAGTLYDTLSTANNTTCLTFDTPLALGKGATVILTGGSAVAYIYYQIYAGSL